MRAGFYPRLAIDAMRKNKRMYLPYLLTCIGMIAMCYIISFLQHSDAVAASYGSDTVQIVLGLGCWVIALFSAIFLIYTNSFLIRRRKQEFGLYNILGMNKRNIARVLFWETLIVAFLSLALGLAAGIALSKLAQLCLANVMHAPIDYALSVSPAAALLCAAIFSGIFAFIYLNTLRQVRFAGALELLRSDRIGEKPPKGNLLLGLAGIVILAAAYYIALKNADPISALTMFFVAVILVIVASYLIFISFSVLLCRFLQKRKGYYYQPNHFVSVSSMAYRMKRNGAGLGSICIIATMVLVMLSSTFSLFFGAESSLHARYPKEINLSLMLYKDVDQTEHLDRVRECIDRLCKEHGAQIQNLYDYKVASIAGLLTGDTVECDESKVSSYDMANLRQFYFISLADYNRLCGQNETLSAGQALIYCNRSGYTADTLSFNEGPRFQIKKKLTDFIGDANAAMDIVSTIYVIVPDLDSGVGALYDLTDTRGRAMVTTNWIYNFDTGLSEDKQTTLAKAIRRDTHAYLNAEINGYGYSCSVRASERNEYYGFFGSLMFLGVMLSILFLFAAILIIYYKQISEGYEDRERFAIMQKIGMTEREIKKSINSQLLTVFFLPLLLAGCHLAFAFPMIREILRCFNLNNAGLFACTTVVSYLVFALFYAIVYRITSNAYYNIINRTKND